ITVAVSSGFEYSPVRRTISLKAGESGELTIALQPLVWRADHAAHWISGDLHAHMNYGGEYASFPWRLVSEAEAEGLQVVNNLIVNKEQRIPDIAYSGGQLDAASNQDVLLVHGQEFHTSYWGHRGLLNIRDHILLPGYAGYPNTA